MLPTSSTTGGYARRTILRELEADLRRSRIDADVFDVNGRRLAVLAQHEVFEAGTHALKWDGLDRGALLQRPASISCASARRERRGS